LLTKVLVHSVVFAVVFYLTAPMALQLSANVEGFRRPPYSGTLTIPNTSVVVPMDGSDRVFSTDPNISSTGVKKPGVVLGGPSIFGYPNISSTGVKKPGVVLGGPSIFGYAF
jgi:hypothetical protein